MGLTVPSRTGFASLDAKTGGLQPSDLILIAGRPGLGKTSLALNIVEHAAVVQRKTCAFFSMEMSEMQVVQRLVSMLAEIEEERAVAALREVVVVRREEHGPVAAPFGAVVRRMREQAPNESGTRGSILLMGSVTATDPVPELFGTHAYAAARGAALRRAGTGSATGSTCEEPAR